MQAVIFPYLYSILSGTAWAIFFRRQFYESLAPGFFTQILIVLTAVCFLHNFDSAIIIGIVLDAALLIVGIVKGIYVQRKDNKAFPSHFWKGLIVFTIFYCIVWNINVGKRFTGYDEFQNWGMFLKESLRLNDL